VGEFAFKQIRKLNESDKEIDIAAEIKKFYIDL